MLLILLSVLCLASVSSAQLECTAQNDGRFYRDPNDCSGYFVCFRGAFLHKFCPDGFHFDEPRQMCNCPLIVGCNITTTTPPCPTVPTTSPMTTPTTESYPTQPPKPSICPPSGLHKLPHPYSCSKYILCFDGVDVERLCSPGLYWNSELLRCVPRNFSDCLLPMPCPRENDPENIIFIPGPNCQTYSICHNGKPVEFDCGDGFHFEPILNRCVHKEDSRCEPLILPEIIEVECDARNSTAYFVPHPSPNECQFYFVCIQGTSHLLKCANSLLFDPNLLKCFFEDQVSCRKTK